MKPCIACRLPQLKKIFSLLQRTTETGFGGFGGSVRGLLADDFEDA
ncbi:MAG: hypothetical protein ACYC67_16840 [Prosthecobacter sp.]